MLSRLDQFNGTVIKPVWDGQNMLVEQDGSNVTQVVYTHQPQQYGRLVSQKRGTAKRYYHYNLIGTTDRLTDASQAVTDSYILEAFGALQTSSGSTVNPFKFIGELGYYNYQTSALTTATWVRARHYEPIYYRWLSEDPIGLSRIDDNLYNYVARRPLLLQDSSGKVIYCYGISGFLGLYVGVSGAVMRCYDTCGNPPTYVACGGGGIVGGGSITGGGVAGIGCLCPGWCVQITVQGSVGVVGGGFSGGTCGGGGGGGLGLGAGGAVTAEGCYTW